MVEYADKAAEPHSRLKYCFNDVVVLCICNGPEVVCVMLIKWLHGATVTGHLLSVKPYLHWNTGWVSIALHLEMGVMEMPQFRKENQIRFAKSVFTLA